MTGAVNEACNCGGESLRVGAPLQLWYCSGERCPLLQRGRRGSSLLKLRQRRRGSPLLRRPRLLPSWLPGPGELQPLQMERPESAGRVERWQDAGRPWGGRQGPPRGGSGHTRQRLHRLPSQRRLAGWLRAGCWNRLAYAAASFTSLSSELAARLTAQQHRAQEMWNGSWPAAPQRREQSHM